MYVLSIINQKGGVAKTTTAAAVGAGLSSLKKKSVLYIDLDPQCNLSYTFGADVRGLTIVEVLRGEDASAAICRTEQGDIIPGSIMLANADTIITGARREYRLRDALSGVTGYDFLIIDTPPALGLLTVNALTASDGAIIPAKADIYSMHGIGQLNQTIETVREHCNPKLRIAGIVITSYSGRATVNRDAADMIDDAAKMIKTRLFKTRIREYAAIREAQMTQRSIFDYAPKSNAASDYADLVDEILENIGGADDEEL